MQHSRILVVEDQAIVARDIHMRLTALGYIPVDTAAQGARAVALAGELRPDLALMDIRLQGAMDGIEAAVQIRDRYQIPVVFLTAYAEDSTLERAKAAEPYGYIIKPFEDRELHTVIELALHKHRTEQCLRDSQERLNLALDASRTGVWEWDLRTDKVYWSPQCLDLFGLPEFNGTFDAFTRTLHPDDVDAVVAAGRKAIADHTPLTAEYRIIRPDGELRWVSNLARAKYDAQGNPLRMIGTAQDITERKRHEEEIERLNRLYAVLSQVNQAIVRSTAPDAMMQAICRVVVDFGGFRHAWVGQFDAPTRRLTPQTHAGYATHFPQPITIPTEIPDDHSCPIHRALHTERPATAPRCPSCRATPTRPVNETSTLPGACAAFPLRCGGSVCGVLTLTSDQPDQFSRAELNLLEEIGMDLSYALDHFREEENRRRAEAAVRESEAKFRSYLEHAPFAVFVADAQGRCVEVNPAATALLGHTASSLHHQRFLDFISPEDREQAAQDFAALLHTGHSAGEHRMHRADGTLIWVAWRAVRVTEDRFLAFCRDTTERKRSEEQLRKLSRAVEQSASVIVITDPKGNIEYVNPKFTELTGYTPEEARGQNPRVLKSGEMGPDAYRDLWHTISRGDEWRGEFHNRKKTGELFWESASISPVVDDTGRITHFVAVKEDITERKRVEEERRASEAALRESEARFRALVENAPAGIFVQTDDRFSYVNQYAVRLFGANTPEDLVGRPVVDHFHPDFRSQVRERIRILNEHRQPVPLVEERCLRIDGSAFDVEISATPFVYQGQPGALVFCRDVGDRKALEIQLRQAQKMEAVGQLAGGIAHDFNNILAATMLHLGMLQEHPDLDAELRESLRELESQAKRAADLTRQLLLFSRRSVIQVHPLELNEVVESLLKMLRRLIGEHITLDWQGKAQLPRIMADAGMIDQVVMNLVVNARDAMPQGGSIRIATDTVELNGDTPKQNPDARPGRFVRLAVTDTGCGMDDSTLKRIFEPFFTTKDPGKGTGLGLATVYGILKQHQGWVEVDSTRGQGSTFRILLPALAAASDAHAPAKVEPIRGGHESILLVEDDAAVRTTVATFLRRCGYQVFEATQGQQAIALWNQCAEQIDLLLTDMVMPGGLSGLNLTQRLRATKPKLKVILTSGYSAELSQHTGHFAKGIRYLPKPCPPAELAAAVRLSLDQPDLPSPTS